MWSYRGICKDVESLGFRGLGLQDLRTWVSGLRSRGCKVQGLGLEVQASGFRVGGGSRARGLGAYGSRALHCNKLAGP